MDDIKVDSEDKKSNDFKAKTESEIKQITNPVLKEKCLRLLKNIHNYKMNCWANRRMERIMGDKDK